MSVNQPLPPPPAVANASEVPICPACLDSAGLCLSCSRGVLPRLAQPSWYRLIGEALVEQKRRQDRNAPSPEAARIKERRARKASRLSRALNGEFTPVRGRVAA